MANVTATKKRTDKTYTISGDTLEEIQDDLFAKQIGGADAVGKCDAGIKTPAITKFHEEKNPKPKKKGTVEYTVTAKSGQKVELTATITMPTLKSDKKLSAKAKKEWERFHGKLGAHEEEHFAAAWKLAQDIASELSALKGVGVGKDEKAALKKAKDHFKSQFNKGYSSGEVTKKLNAANKPLDSGNKNVFTLNINID